VYDNYHVALFQGDEAAAGAAQRDVHFRLLPETVADAERPVPACERQAQGDEESPFASLDSEFVVVNRNGVFQVDADLTVTRFEKYLAIGSGDKYAYGALHTLYDTKRGAKEIAFQAVQTAVHFDSTCGGEIECYEIA